MYIKHLEYTRLQILNIENSNKPINHQSRVTINRLSISRRSEYLKTCGLRFSGLEDRTLNYTCPDFKEKYRVVKNISFLKEIDLMGINFKQKFLTKLM